MLLVLCGCAAHGPRKVVEPKASPVLNQRIDITGNIVLQDKLNKGGRIAFTDLKAGPLAIADEQTDRVALKIIQGVTDVIVNSNVGITITNDPHEANLVFEGYIEEFSVPSKFSKMFLLKQRSRVSISGEVYDRSTGMRVLSFASSKTFNNSKENPMQAGLSIGNAIGQFICSHVTKEQP